MKLFWKKRKLNKNQVITLDKVIDIIEDSCGSYSKIYEIDREKKTVTCILYDSFVLECDLSDYRSFGVAILPSKDQWSVGSYLGEKMSLNRDPVVIKENFMKIDHYCRTILPEKFLKAYDEAYHDKQDI